MSRPWSALAPLVLASLLGWSPGATSAADSKGAITEDTRVDRSKVQADVRTLVSRVEDLAGTIQDLHVKETAVEIRIELAADVLFDFDKADIKPEAQQVLKKAAALIREKAKGTVEVEGHTDAKGTDAYNQKLSERRAGSVRDWLVSREGLNDIKFATHGLGAKKPVVSNTRPDGSDDPEGRQKNRRVEIVVKK
ncbi:MAG: OmpA family protein [Candidatus Rokuibacteriota bacterium]|nr:MAG: OmpA family protein [Candidatus Rokubacteria bacterium]